MGVRTTVSDQAWSVLAPTFDALTPPRDRNALRVFRGRGVDHADWSAVAGRRRYSASGTRSTNGFGAGRRPSAGSGCGNGASAGRSRRAAVTRQHDHQGASTRGWCAKSWRRSSRQSARSVTGRIHHQASRRRLQQRPARLIHCHWRASERCHAGEALITGLSGKAVVADRAYDSDAFLAAVTGSGMRAVVPSRATRRSPRSLDSEAYGRRNVIERWFGRVKQYRRVATRYDKTATSYGSFAAPAALCTRLSGWAA
jgi:transposase